MDSPKTVRKLRELAELHHEFLCSLEPNNSLKAIHVSEGCIDLPKWLLICWDKEVLLKSDFIYVSDAHYKRSGFYVDYDSLLGLDYDDLIDRILK
jgi:hypothetical protein